MFHKFGLIVTGDTERDAVHRLFRSLAVHGCCDFILIRKIDQRTPVTSKKRIIEMVGSGKKIPDKDETEIGLFARFFLADNDSRVIVLDDLEGSRAMRTRDVFDRYRSALDTMLTIEQRSRASVHFLVNMLEAYFFADASATNAVLGTSLADYPTDVELIPHPKNQLKQLCNGFNEISDGAAILSRLNVAHVLSDPATCSSLRSLFLWCWYSFGAPVEDRFCFETGAVNVVTGTQLRFLAS